jgi:GT2 family glycosyltransferase
MKISVIIVTFNGKQYLPDLLKSLSKTKWPSQSEHEIIFVDNASTDGTVDHLTFNLPSCAYLFCLDQNRGFAGGNNVGIKQAFANESNYIVLLNQDTVVEPMWIQELIKVAESNSAIGAVQSLLLYWDKKDTINSYGNYIHFLGFQFAGGNLTKLKDAPFITNHSKLNSKSSLNEILRQAQDDLYEVTYASGAAVLYKAKTLEKVGLFDAILQSYHEDSDICLRMRLAGFKTYLAPKSIVYHKYKFIKQDKNGKYKYYLMERNRLYTLLKFYKLKTLILIFPAWLVMEIGILGFSLIRGFFIEKIKGYGWIIKNLGLILRKRKEIQTHRSSYAKASADKQIMSDKELMKNFVGWIEFQEINNPLLKYIGNPIMKIYWRIIKVLI